MRQGGMALGMLLCALIGIGPLAQFGAGGRAQAVRYDGAWWSSISSGQRFGFMGGFGDCYRFDFKGPASFKGMSVYGYRDSLTQGFQRGRFALDELISHAFLQLQDTIGEKPIGGRHGEVYTEPHGYLDGTYWQNEDTRSHDVQLGFLQGFLSCHAELAQNKGGMFSKTPEEYRILISGWYGLNEETGRIDARREPTKIADVLFKFRDGDGNDGH